jgi:hypothetical protein
MAPRALTAADGESDDPQNEEDECSDPQEMDGEPGTEEDQHQQQCENEQHETDSFSEISKTPGDPREVRDEAPA